MSELRKDPLTNRWVIIAQNRAQRPHEFQPVTTHRTADLCPFCEGNESKTPAEVLAYRDPDGQPNQPGWRVRVVPNKFPALVLDDPLNRSATGPYESLTGTGIPVFRSADQAMRAFGTYCGWRLAR